MQWLAQFAEPGVMGGLFATSSLGAMLGEEGTGSVEKDDVSYSLLIPVLTLDTISSGYLRGIQLCRISFSSFFGCKFQSATHPRLITVPAKNQLLPISRAADLSRSLQSLLTVSATQSGEVTAGVHTCQIFLK